MRERFELVVKHRGHHLSVLVEGTRVTVADAVTLRRLAVGIWDAGKYVRYEHSFRIAIHPTALDAIDEALREAMTLPGESPRAAEPRRSAIGYQY